MPDFFQEVMYVWISLYNMLKIQGSCSYILSLNYMAKRERCQAERKWRKTKLTIFKDLYRQAKHKVSKLVHTANCNIYTERIILASSSKELHQIVNTLSNRLPPKILPTN